MNYSRRFWPRTILAILAVLCALNPAHAQTTTDWARGTVLHCVPVPVSQRVIALTFDDGPEPVYTPQILRVLADNNVKGTFFMMGSHVSEYPALARSVRDAGHALGNHTWSHSQTPSDPASEVTRTVAVMQSVLGVTPILFRPPFGNLNNGVAAQALAQRDAVVMWSSDPNDWATPGADIIASRVVSQATSGGIILLHDGGGDRSQTVAALPTIIRELKARGYRFVTMPELLALYDTTGGDGLAATYFDNADFTGAQVSRIDSQVNFNWGTGAPAFGIAPDTFSARWSGQVQPLTSEAYTFSITSDDGVRLWVNGQLLINDWTARGLATRSGTINLLAGARYDIQLEYFDNTGGASAQLFWNSYSTPRQLVPRRQLFSRRESAQATPTVSINTPQTNYSYSSLGGATGVAASSGVAALQSVGGFLYRYSDSTYWNGAAWTTTATQRPAQGTTSWALLFPALLDGRYSFQAIARDSNGASASTASLPFYIDTRAPFVSVSAPLNGTSYKKIPSGASGTAGDGVGLQQVRGRLFNQSTNTYWNGNSWTASPVEVPCSGTTNWTFAFPTLARGSYTFRASATDYIGLTGFSPTIAFSVSR